MSALHRAAILFVVLVPSGAVVACSGADSKPSGPGSTSTSTSTSTPDAGGDAAGDAGTALKKNAEQGCTKNEECASNVCFIGGTQSFCSVKCTVNNQATVCVTPFTGTCNKQGFCKRD